MRVIKRGRRHIVVTTSGLLPEQVAGEAARRGVAGAPAVRPVLRFEPRAADVSRPAPSGSTAHAKTFA